MKSATISEAKNHFSELIARVKRGESVLILERDRPVARLTPIEAAHGDDEERLAVLERHGVLRRAALAPLKKLPPPIKLPKGVSLLDALLEDREDSRY